MKKNKPEMLPKTASGAICTQMVRCNHPGCKCMKLGERHGPYYYFFWREEGKLRKKYVRKQVLPQMEVECAERRRARRELRESKQTWRALLGQLREIEHQCKH